jgi:hypothetical protein
MLLLAEVSPMTCSHFPSCPGANESDACAAAIVTDHCEQGWYLLCNGLILFDDGMCLRGPETTAA